jgi:hypothetical protein
MPKPDDCYMCEMPATSVEHVPAKCFFPETKDLSPGMDLRRNLFTVPSCDAHNSAKSKDDQYLWQIMLGARGLNECGQRLLRTKGVRSITRRPASMAELMGGADLAAIYDFEIGAWLPTGVMHFNGERVYSVLRHFARALYFWHFKSRWLGIVKLMPNFVKFSRSAADRDWQKVIQLSAGVMKDRPRYGDNPDVFYYQEVSDSHSGALMSATFYGGLTVTCVFSAEP